MKNNTSKQTIFMGLDISKNTISVCLKKQGQKKPQSSLEVANHFNDLKKFFTSLKKDRFQVIIAMESTGVYTETLLRVLMEMPYKVYVVPPNLIHKSRGLRGNKNDKVDAYVIAQFIEKWHSELHEYIFPGQTLRTLYHLLRVRKQKLKLKNALINQKKELETVGIEELEVHIAQIESLLATIIAELKELEKKIESPVQSDRQLSSLVKLLRSVPGVGLVLSWYLVVKTQAFQRFSPYEARRFACMVGVVPFEHVSGSSVWKRPKVSFFADKELKSLFYLASMSACQRENDFRRYYLRKVEKGKNKRSALIAVANKMIHRIFAVVKHQTMYQDQQIVA